MDRTTGSRTPSETTQKVEYQAKANKSDIFVEELHESEIFTSHLSKGKTKFAGTGPRGGCGLWSIKTNHSYESTGLDKNYLDLVWGLELRTFGVGLEDLKYSGAHFSWPGTRNGTKIYEKLDRAMANFEWSLDFQNSSCLCLPIQRSDHGPLVISTKPSSKACRRPCKLAHLQNNPHIPSNILEENNLRAQLDLLLIAEESYWHQRTKLNRINNGDVNSEFYHSYIKHKAKINSILEICYSDNNIITDEDDIINHYFSHFSNFYNPPQTPVRSFKTISNISSGLNNDQVDDLNRPFTAIEVKKDIFQMYPDKSPGANEFPAGFFKNNWNLLGEDLTTSILDFLNNNEFLKEINNTFITLIPKLDNPSSLADFRPISLCNTMYKIASKTMVNRLKPHLNHLLSPFQNGFINGRLVHDSV
ncbi:hypothetical protein LIER_28346 [Lithospermum erythrorhizon]|uniref:Reverse transcriptase domain-containing protein n=1 Tax=Lithospermum erythrorhizon TaxID=34254 RepID=A0AAV3RJI9_LITER